MPRASKKYEKVGEVNPNPMEKNSEYRPFNKLVDQPFLILHLPTSAKENATSVRKLPLENCTCNISKLKCAEIDECCDDNVFCASLKE